MEGWNIWIDPHTYELRMNDRPTLKPQQMLDAMTRGGFGWKELIRRPGFAVFVQTDAKPFHNIFWVFSGEEVK